MFNQARILGETDEALKIRIKDLMPRPRTSEDERRAYFIEGTMPSGWEADSLEFSETLVPAEMEYEEFHIDLGTYAPPTEANERFIQALKDGYVPTHQGLQHPELGQLDLSIPSDPIPYLREAHRQLQEQDIPFKRVFQKDGQYFLLWELMRSPDKPSEDPLVTELVLLVPTCLGEIYVTELQPKKIPPSAETFAYHQIFIMLERLYAEWPDRERLMQEIAMNILTLRDLEARNLPRAFSILHLM